MNAHSFQQLHILSVLVENKSGVLARVASLFARRGFNIHSLAVAPTNEERFSRITIVVDLESAPLEQITKQLDKLIHVVRIEELRPADAVERELMLVTVEKGTEPHVVLDIANRNGGYALDFDADHITFSFGGAPSRLDAIERELTERGINRIQRTGRIALPRLAVQSQPSQS
jgi:acetolactate synthase I/III small subunit